MQRQYPRSVRVHDVSLVMRPDMTTWNKEPGPTITPLRRIAEGDTANVSTVSFGDHTGTHVDPPLHFIEGGRTVDELPLDALVGPCVVVAYEGSAHIDDAWLERAPVAAGTTRILFRTRNSELWREPTAEFTRDFVTLNASAARWCVSR